MMMRGIVLTEDYKANIEIYNTNGQRLVNKIDIKNTTQLDLSDNPNDIHILIFIQIFVDIPRTPVNAQEL